jgi:hypothetical protein
MRAFRQFDYETALDGRSLAAAPQGRSGHIEAPIDLCNEIFSQRLFLGSGLELGQPAQLPRRG